MKNPRNWSNPAKLAAVAVGGVVGLMAGNATVSTIEKILPTKEERKLIKDSQIP